MFSKILANFKNLFPWLSSDTTHSQNLADQQLLFELAQACLAINPLPLAMVATRSHDHEIHVSPFPESRVESTKRTPMESKAKRKTLASVTAVSTPSSSTKRRKLNGLSSKSEGNTPQTFAAVVIPTSTTDTVRGHSTDSIEDDVSKSARESGSIDPGDGRPLAGAHKPNIETGARVQRRDEESGPQSPPNLEKSTMDEQSTPIPTKKATLSSSSNGKKSRRKDPRMEDASITIVSPRISSTNTPADPSMSQHKRFDIEEVDSAPLFPTADDSHAVKNNNGDRHEDTEGESSNDDAPETITQSAGLEKARSAAAEAAKAAEAQRALIKQKRREHNSLLKFQIKATERRAEQNKPKDIGPEQTTADERRSQVSPPPLDMASGLQWSSKDPLPALLPDELLAAEPMYRLPTPSPEPIVTKALVNKKQRFLEETSKPPKDVRKGNVRIRVLEEKQGRLAPKVSKSSQVIRESWLAGRPGAKGRVMMERRKMGGGFIRR